MGEKKKVEEEEEEEERSMEGKREGRTRWMKEAPWCVSWKPHTVEGRKLHSIYSSRLTFIRAEKSQRQRPQAHVPTTRKEQGMQPISPSSPSHCVQDTAHKLILSTIKMGLPASVNINEIICQGDNHPTIPVVSFSHLRTNSINWWVDSSQWGKKRAQCLFTEHTASRRVKELSYQGRMTLGFRAWMIGRTLVLLWDIKN